MSIKAIFPQGQTHITVNGLHQWDYGQCLEIHADDLPTVFEVHFACVGETEAKVRSCSAVNGVGTVPIPDACLEHATPILAWIYAIDGTEGATVKTITLEVMVRAKPLPGEDIPVEVYDKYTEVITEMNGAVGALKDGSVVVGHALTADNATKADRATIANIALKADNATHAENADNVAQADKAANADNALVANSVRIDDVSGMGTEIFYPMLTSDDGSKTPRIDRNIYFDPTTRTLVTEHIGGTCGYAAEADLAYQAKELLIEGGFTRYTEGQTLHPGVYLARFAIVRDNQTEDMYGITMALFSISDSCCYYIGESFNNDFRARVDLNVIDVEVKALFDGTHQDTYKSLSTVNNIHCDIYYKKIASVE